MIAEVLRMYPWLSRNLSLIPRFEQTAPKSSQIEPNCANVDVVHLRSTEQVDAWCRELRNHLHISRYKIYPIMTNNEYKAYSLCIKHLTFRKNPLPWPGSQSTTPEWNNLLLIHGNSNVNGLGVFIHYTRAGALDAMHVSDLIRSLTSPALSDVSGAPPAIANGNSDCAKLCMALVLPFHNLLTYVKKLLP